MEKTIDHRLAWLAGIIDGEGWIGLRLEHQQRSKAQRERGVKGWTGVSFSVAVANTDMGMLAEIASIADLIGAKFGFTAHIKQNPRHREQGRVTFHTRKDCATVLGAVLPYLITKRPQAELMLRAIEHRNKTASPGRHPEKRGYIAVARDSYLHEMIDQMHAMNRRGVEVPNG